MAEVPFTLGVLSDKTDVPKETLRRWLKEGLIKPVGENSQNQPVFSAETVELAKLLRTLREQGYGLNLLKGKSEKDLKGLINK